jgi:antitoxin MazE
MYFAFNPGRPTRACRWEFIAYAVYGATNMHTKVKKWGNSLALRIPKAIADNAHIKNNTAVDISLVDGRLVVHPLSQSPWTLEQLLAGIHKSNLHHEVNTGLPSGKELW